MRVSAALVAATAVGGVAASSGAVAAASSARVPRSADVTLVVYSAQGYDKAMTTAFSKKYHITVSLDDNSTGPLLTQIAASKNNPKWGLLWVDGATAFAGLDTQHLLLQGWEPSVSWNSLGKEALPTDKSYIPTGVTLAGSDGLQLQKGVHSSCGLERSLSSTWKGKVGTNDPSQSGPTYPSSPA